MSGKSGTARSSEHRKSGKHAGSKTEYEKYLRALAAVIESRTGLRGAKALEAASQLDALTETIGYRELVVIASDMLRTEAPKSGNAQVH